MAFDKAEWQRQRRRKFAEEHGYSTAAHYATGQLREAVLERDGRKCVRCGMTEQQHLETWKRPITVDHKDRDHGHNEMDNLQTLCLPCHGSKDISRKLIIPKVIEHRADILARRAKGQPYQQIADEVGFSIAAIWKWVKRWDGETNAQ